MSTSEKENKRKGLIATIAVHVAMVLMFIFFGITKMIPPPEDGIAINFGYEEDGSGTNEQAAPQQPQTRPQEMPQETTEQIDKVVTQESVDAPSVHEEKPKPKTQPTEKPVDKTRELTEAEKRLEAMKNKDKESAQSGQGQGEGETTGGGDQGDPNGDRNSQNREGGGAGGTGDYRLGGRKALERPKPVYDCAEEGRVVVKIWVDRQGRVINATPGEKIPAGPASTTTITCLYNRAKEAAMRTTWQPDANAPDNQVGYIIYNFQKQ